MPSSFWILIIGLFIVHVCLTSMPNVIIIFADDMGYGDLQCYGHPSQERGPLERMAEEGMRFTHWYSADSLCTPSRAALLTGRLPIRIGMVGPDRVLWQYGAGGLPEDEITMAEKLKQLGYVTGMVGKWHLGINKHYANDGLHLPGHHGFDFVGVNFPYGQNWKCDPKKFSTEEMSVKCFKYRNETFIQQPVVMENTTREMVNDVKKFIADNRQRPFFFYFPLLQTHSSLYCSEGFCSSSKRGIYGDSINEMSWAVGEVLDALKENAIDHKTLVVFLSDHGPQLEMCNEGGSAGMFRGGKGSSWEGGVRVPAIAWWPGTIPAGTVSDTIVSTMDLYPTVLHMAGYEHEEGFDKHIDGKNIIDVLKNNNNSSPHETIFHYCSDRLMAVRYGKFKLHYHTQEVVHNYTDLCHSDGGPRIDKLHYLNCYGENIVSHDPPLIFNVEEDPGESYPRDPSAHGDIINLVAAASNRHETTISREVPSQLGLNDESLQPCCNPPHCLCNYPISKGNARVEL